MKLGKRLWFLIAVKLFIILVVIKWLFFPDILKDNFSNDKQRGDYVFRQLTGG